MNNLINHLLHKKFSVRVVHFTQEYFKVQYANYRIFPTWHNINYFFQAGYTGDLEGWSIELFRSYTAAEDFASKLKSYQDVVNYYSPRIEFAKEWKLRKKEYLAKNIPYHSKIIR